MYLSAFSYVNSVSKQAVRTNYCQTHKALDKKRYNELSDSEVLDLYMNSQSSMYFDLLYSRYINKVYSKCISLLKDEVLAQDAAQEIFVKIFLNLSKFNKKSKFSTWIYSITYNYCIDVIRKQKKLQKVITKESEQLPDIEQEEINDKELLEIEYNRLSEVLEHIPVQDKAVLLMKYQDDMSIKEISQVLVKSESAIKMKIKRAKFKAHNVYQKLFPNS